jgi:ribokinase
MKPILVVGSYNIGLVTLGERIPAVGETVSHARFERMHGGKGSNQAVAAARLGAPVRMIARIGEDAFGTEALTLYDSEGIDRSGVLVAAGEHTGVGMVMVDGQARNAIAVVPGANGRLTPEAIAGHEALFVGCGVLLVQLETPIETVQAAVDLARRHGLTVILNPAPAMPVDDRLLAGCDLVTPNETEAESLTGIRITDVDAATAAGASLRRRGARRAIITMAERGSVLVDEDGAWHHPALIVRAVATTGAGDAYTGGLAFALARGDDLRNAVRFATRVAARKVQYAGAIEGLPRLDQLDASASNPGV